MTNNIIKFCGWTGPQSSYGLFMIDRYSDALENSDPYVSILIVHEGNRTKPLNNISWPECEYYEQAQKVFGYGLDFIEKNYDQLNHCTSFLFRLSNNLIMHKLVVPATGEDFYFKIYGINQFGNKKLLIEMEL